MASVLGRAVVFGIDGTVAYTGMATTGNEPENLEYTENYKTHETRAKDGETIGLVFYDKQEELTIDFFPCAAAGVGAIATAKANIVLPAIGAKVTIAAMSGSVANDTTWLYVGGGKIRWENENIVKMTLPLKQFSTDIGTATT